MRILLVEDDAPLALGLQTSLRSDSYSVDWVNTGRAAVEMVRAHTSELVILDLGLPDMDGLDVLRQIKQIDKSLPVLVLTARDGLEHRVEGLDLGADDYLGKPFAMAELLARLRVMERRLGTSVSAFLTVGDVAIDTRAHVIRVAGQPLNFSRREYMIIKALMENTGRIQSKPQLENTLYEWGEEVASNTIEVHVHHLRKKLPPDFIKTVRGVGYIVNP
ncbi:response regulator transcription factor [Pseudomonadales bacterium]|nr:response regulator transcription factor [Pseudomonadales bacterium]